MSALQARGEILKIIRELLVLSELHHVVEVLHVLDDRVQLENTVTVEMTGPYRYFDRSENNKDSQKDFLNVLNVNKR